MIMESTGILQLRRFGSCLNHQKYRPSSLLVVEGTVTTMRTAVSPCYQETTAGFMEVEMLHRQLMQADNRAQLSYVDFKPHGSRPNHENIMIYIAK